MMYFVGNKGRTLARYSGVDMYRSTTYKGGSGRILRRKRDGAYVAECFDMRTWVRSAVFMHEQEAKSFLAEFLT
jgi:hypothetical protein